MRLERLDQRRTKQHALVTSWSFTSFGWILLLLLCITSLSHCDAFVVSPALSSRPLLDTSMFLAKKKRRRRKVPPKTADATAATAPDTKTTTTARAAAAPPPPVASAAVDVSSKQDSTTDVPATNTAAAAAASTAAPSTPPPEDTKKAAEELAAFRQVANFAFQPETDPTKKVPIVDIPDGVVNSVIDEDTSNVVEAANDLVSSQAIPLPDIREARRMKQAEQKKRDAEMETKNRKVKIKRSDTAAFTKVRI